MAPLRINFQGRGKVQTCSRACVQAHCPAPTSELGRTVDEWRDVRELKECDTRCAINSSLPRFLAEVKTALKPAGPIEHFLSERICLCMVRLKRASRLEVRRTLAIIQTSRYADLSTVVNAASPLQAHGRRVARRNIPTTAAHTRSVRA